MCLWVAGTLPSSPDSGRRPRRTRSEQRRGLVEVVAVHRERALDGLGVGQVDTRTASDVMFYVEDGQTRFIV